MHNIFGVESGFMKSGTLLVTRYTKEKRGVLELYQHEGIALEQSPEKSKIAKDCIFLRGRVRRYVGSYEEPGYEKKEAPPNKREKRDAHMDYDFDCFDIIPTSDEGRFFSLKELDETGGEFSITLIDNPGGKAEYALGVGYNLVCENAYHFEPQDYSGLADQLGLVLRDMGVPELEDIARIQEDIFEKFQYPQGVITTMPSPS